MTSTFTSSSPMFSVFYSDDEHDHFFDESPSLFEATVEAYCMLDDLADSEWITLRDSNGYTIMEFN